MSKKEFPESSWFNELQELEQYVHDGEYFLVAGSAKSINISKGNLRLFPIGGRFKPKNIMPGVHIRGLFYVNDKNKEVREVVSFLYHKIGPDGQIEAEERLIALSGIGYGEHPAHQGQPPAWYLVGAQIGTVDPKTYEIKFIDTDDEFVDAKHFSFASIVDGPADIPILANPVNLN